MAFLDGPQFSTKAPTRGVQEQRKKVVVRGHVKNFLPKKLGENLIPVIFFPIRILFIAFFLAVFLHEGLKNRAMDHATRHSVITSSLTVLEALQRTLQELLGSVRWYGTMPIGYLVVWIICT
jgi:hypothetical protein